jgi:hypothetical protein
MGTKGQTNGRTDMTKPHTAFRDYTNAPKTVFNKKNSVGSDLMAANGT